MKQPSYTSKIETISPATVQKRFGGAGPFAPAVL